MRSAPLAIAAAVALVSCCAVSACRREEAGQAGNDTVARSSPSVTPTGAPQPAATPAFSPPDPISCVRPSAAIPTPHRLAGKPVRIPPSLEGVRTAGSTLVYEATIGEDGQVRNVRLVRPLPTHPGYPEIDRHFRETLLTWRYTQTVIDGRAVSVCLTISATVDVR